MKIEFDSSNETDMQMVSRMISFITPSGHVAAEPQPTPVATIPTPGADAPLVNEQLTQDHMETAGAGEVLVDTAAPGAEETVVANVVPGELDAAGIPWDARIHASTKTKKTDLTWKARRGVDQAVIENVTAELVAIAAVTPVVNLAATPEVVAPVVGATQAQAAAVFGGQQAAPVADNVTPIAGAVAEANTQTPQTWPEVMQVIVAKQNAGTLNQDALNAFLAANQVTAFPLLSNRPDLYPALLAAVL